MIVVAAGVAVLYGIGVRRLARRRRRWPATRSIPFALGITALIVASLVPQRSFTTHMIEHILLGMAAPLFLALGAPITLALQAAGPETKATLRRVLHHPAARVLAQPLLGWALFGGTMIVYYFSPLLSWSAQHELGDAALHLHFVVAGSLFVWPLVAIDPIPTALPFGGRLLAVLAAVPFHAIVGVAILTASRPLAPDSYPSLSDQHSAAGLLWGSGELFTVALAAVVFFRWAASDLRAGARLDRSEQETGEIVVGGAGHD